MDFHRLFFRPPQTCRSNLFARGQITSGRTGDSFLSFSSISRSKRRRKGIGLSRNGKINYFSFRSSYSSAVHSSHSSSRCYLLDDQLFVGTLRSCRPKRIAAEEEKSESPSRTSLFLLDPLIQIGRDLLDELIAPLESPLVSISFLFERTSGRFQRKCAISDSRDKLSRKSLAPDN